MTKLIKIGWRKWIMILDTDNLKFVDEICKQWKTEFPKIKLIIVPKTY